MGNPKLSSIDNRLTFIPESYLLRYLFGQLFLTQNVGRDVTIVLKRIQKTATGIRAIALSQEGQGLGIEPGGSRLVVLPQQFLQRNSFPANRQPEGNIPLRLGLRRKYSTLPIARVTIMYCHLHTFLRNV